MRHVPLKGLIKTIFANATGKQNKQRLVRAHKALKGKAKDQRQNYIDQNGSKKWSPIKNRMTSHLGNKCWYTEAEVIGASLTIDHYRPKSDYWWLAFDVENYRVACPYANSPKHNEEQGCAGGKGDSFPLLDEKKRATCKGQLKYEKPVILDPCKKEDCDSVAFHSDGRCRESRKLRRPAAQHEGRSRWHQFADLQPERRLHGIVVRDPDRNRARREQTTAGELEGHARAPRRRYTGGNTRAC